MRINTAARGHRVDAQKGSGAMTAADKAAALTRIQALAKLMDSAFTVPGTNVRMGVDAALGIIPVVGDLISQAIASYIIWEARQLGVSRWTMARMIGNSAIDTVVGAVPLVGDLFDVAYRSNLKNLKLLEAHLAREGVAVDVARGADGKPVIEGDFRRVG